MEQKRNRILFLGSSSFSIKVLDYIIKRCRFIELDEVVTLPPKPRGRGYEIQPNPVKKFCQENSIKVYETDDVNTVEFIDCIQSKKNLDYIIVASFGQILRDKFLTLPVKEILNIHPSLLPRYRGATPIHSALKNGDRITGVSIFKIVKKLDAGDIVAQRSCGIGDNENYEDLENKLSALSAELLCDYMEYKLTGMKRKGIFDPPIKQNDEEATYTHKLTKENCEVDWSRSAQEIHNFIRSLSPHIGAYSYLNGHERIKFFESYVFDKDYSGSEPCGAIKFAIKKGPVVVKCGTGLLAITRLQFPGKRIMLSAEVINGRKVKEGDIFKNAET